MKKNLSDFVSLNKNVISHDLCDITVKELEESSGWREHTFARYDNGERIDYTTEEDPQQHIDPSALTVIPDLIQVYWNVIYKYIAEDHVASWHNSWAGFEPLKFLRYTPDTGMRKHCDHVHSMFDGQKKGIPVLTVIGLFNDNFKGGEFVLFDDEVIPMEKGDILVFPSIFLYPHTVQKVTEGVRYSGSSWVF
jgi:hypothetical protein